jgi:hypothetical protein
MAVLQKISVGDIFYYLVDDIPSHVAPKGSISILKSDLDGYKGTLFVNNNDSNVWLKLIKPSYGQMYLIDNVNEVDFDGFTIGSWYSYSTTPYTANTLNGFTKGNNPTFGDFLEYTGDTFSKIRVAVKSQITCRGGSGKWMNIDGGSAYNFTIPTENNEMFIFDNSSTNNLGDVRIGDMNTNDQYTLAWSPSARETGGGPTTRQLLKKYAQIDVVKIDEPFTKIDFSEDWESSGFTQNSWTVVNDTTNVWVVGQAENNTSGGTSSAYVSDDGGTSASYTITTANVSHFYKDIVIPESGELVFDWKCQGENAGGVTQYDYGAVVITTTGTTPVAGTEVTTTQTDGAATTRIGAEDNDGKFNLNYGTNPGTTWNTETIDLSAYAGQTKRLVFTWKNDGSVGTDPPFVVDNIKIFEYKWI